MESRNYFCIYFPYGKPHKKMDKHDFSLEYQQKSVVNELFRNISRNFPKREKVEKQAVLNLFHRVFHGFEYAPVENPSAFCTRTDSSPFHAVFVDSQKREAQNRSCKNIRKRKTKAKESCRWKCMVMHFPQQLKATARRRHPARKSRFARRRRGA